MNSKYIYHGIDITEDVYEKICSVVELLAQKEQRTFDECYEDFISTRVYEVLQITDSMLWSESAAYIVEDYYREKERNNISADSEKKLPV